MIKSNDLDMLYLWMTKTYTHAEPSVQSKRSLSVSLHSLLFQLSNLF